jgi:chromosome segregation ATPase
MSNISTATYIKKLVKIIYEKEKQIELLKRTIRTHHHTEQPHIDPHIRNELQSASTQLREVNAQINAMERKMQELEAGLEEEITKNAQLEEDISALHAQNRQLSTSISTLTAQISE